jgi:Leucine-rich repeat (LRR) protein
MRQLNLVNNSLEKVTVEDIKDFAEVTLLDLRSNNIEVIDDQVFSARFLPKLQQLFLSGNQLSWLPPNTFQFTVFTTLDLSYNKFSYPPPALGKTHQIATLNLVNNSLEKVTVEDIKDFAEVTLLDLRSNNIEVIDDQVFSARFLPKLQQLFLSGNQLSWLPPNTFQFTVFTTLDLSYNKFSYPPPALGKTHQIATL